MSAAVKGLFEVFFLIGLSPLTWMGLLTLLQRLDADVLVVNRAAGVMPLQRDGSRADAPARESFRARPIGRLRPLGHQLVVHFDRDGVAFRDNVLGEPLVVLRDLFAIVLHFVKTCRLPRV